ncbi:hypothetical protein DSM112329_02831 [Paraconexibacter sp. AEG42_29]|uniref:Uncharacterized protein n=1 Tax=Paraconexibacter sp. AEG42_29 TaxID=2997339 RepID=A0AAU7AWY5_9ACTN
MLGTRLSFECSDAPSCTVIFEPDGFEAKLTNGDALRAEFRGGEELGVIEVTHRPNSISVWARSGAETSVWRKSGEQIY